MSSNRKKYRFLGLIIGLAWLLTACGSSNSNSDNAASATDTPRPAPSMEAPSPTRRPTLAATPTSASRPQTTKAAGGSQAGGTGPSLTDSLPEKTVVRSFQDAQGRSVKLVYGRGTGHNSDYGWAHIYGKHFKGIWYDGGTITTFPAAVNAKTPEQVVDLISKAIQDPKPDDAGNGRRSYVYAVPGTNKDVFVVVGSDGTIITGYPVPHGSKDEDS